MCPAESCQFTVGTRQFGARRVWPPLPTLLSSTPTHTQPANLTSLSNVCENQSLWTQPPPPPVRLLTLTLWLQLLYVYTFMFIKMRISNNMFTLEERERGRQRGASQPQNYLLIAPPPPTATLQQSKVFIKQEFMPELYYVYKRFEDIMMV